MPAHRPPHRPAGTRPRRRHPARVYWLRRFLAFAVLAALVVGGVGLGRLLTGLAGGETGAAQTTSAEPEESAHAPPASASDGPGADREPGPTAPTTQKNQKKAGGTPKPPPAEPEGPCAEEDVVVTPSVKRAVGAPITIRLDLTTLESDACFWRVSPETLTMRITSGEDEIWTSRQCPGALPRQDVVVRKEPRTRVRVDWSARRSDEDCSIFAEWALPGYYQVQAAAFAGEPREDRFELTAPQGPSDRRSPGSEARQRQGQQERQRG